MRAGRWLFALAFFTGEAAGHAGLVASIPADGAALAAPPSSVELRFSEPVTPLEMRLFVGAAPVALAAPHGAADVVNLALPRDPGKGLYTLSYRVISADSHPVGGSIVFAVGISAPQRPAGAGVSTWPSPVLVIVRAIRDFALLIAAGGALFAVVMTRFPAERAILRTAGALVIAAVVADIAVHGAELFWTSFGMGASVAAGGALLIILATTLSSPGVRLALLLIGAIAAIASLPLTGHARTAHPASVAMAVLAAHGLAAAFWAGSLAALLAIMRMHDAAGVLRRFSRWGVAAVATLVLAGIVFALLQLGSVTELFASRYGWLIVAKITLLAGLLVLATLNRWLFLPMLERGAAGAAVRLRRSIAGELALVGCVMGVTAILVQTAPPHGFVQKFANKSDAADVSVKPARAGINTIAVRFHDREGLPFDPEEVLIEIGNEAAGVEAATRPMRRVGAGDYRREGSELAFPGVWTVDVHAHMGGEMANFRARVPIR